MRRSPRAGVRSATREKSERTPTRGARVRVKGQVDQVAVVAGQSVGLHLNERALYVKR